MKNISVYEFKEYKAFLRNLAGGRSPLRGVKAQIAKAAGCQATYLSQVLHGKIHLSAEQLEKVARSFNFSADETDFLLLLLSKDRAGTHELKAHYQKKIDERIKERLNVVHRLGAANPLTEEQHALFYSSWHYLAIHIALTIPALQDRKSLANYFSIPIPRVDEILKFLLEAGLASHDGFKYTPLQQTIRLGKNSPHIYRHHTHWRQQSIESLERETEKDLHYSAVVSLSRSDVLKLKDRMLEQIKENIQIVKDSPAEEMFVFNVDFFSLKKSI